MAQNGVPLLAGHSLVTAVLEATLWSPIQVLIGMRMAQWC